MSHGGGAARPAGGARLVWFYFFLLLAALWTTWEMDKPVWRDPAVAEQFHRRIVDGQAPYPLQYRPLVPLLCEAMTRVGVPLTAAYNLQRFAFWFLALLLFHNFLRLWLPETLCLTGGVFLLAILPFSTIGSGYQPTDPLNLLLFVMAYGLLHERRDGWLYVVVAIGMLNRETIALVALLAAAVRADEWRQPAWWRLVLGLGLLAVAVYAGVHLHYGPRESYTELIRPSACVPENLSRAGSLRVVAVYGLLWWLAFVKLADQPAFLRRSALLIPVFLIVHFAYGLVGETRLFLPLAPAIVPLGLRRLFDVTEPVR